MQIWSLTLTAGLTACSSALTTGDRSFARGEYPAALSAYRNTKDADPDAIAFRLALLAATPGSPTFDPNETRASLEQLAEAYPGTVYGAAAAHALRWLTERDELRTRLEDAQGRVEACSADVGRVDAANRKEVQALQGTIKSLQDEQARLSGELKALRDVHADLVLLQDENKQLKEELDELKRIDLRR